MLQHFADKGLLRRIAIYLSIGCVTYFLLMLMMSDCNADEGRANGRRALDSFHVLELNELSIDYKNFKAVNPNGHDPMTWPDPPKEYLNLGMKLDVLKYGYLDPTVEGWTTDAQYRGVGLEVRLGIRPIDSVEFGLYHHSLHQLDREQQLPMGHFPETDAVELKVYIFHAQPGRPGIF